MESLILDFGFSMICYILYFCLSKILGCSNKEHISINYQCFSFSTTGTNNNGLNVIIKTFLPPVFILVLSGILYNIGRNELVNNIYLVSVFHFTIEWFFLTIFGRLKLIDWHLEIRCAIASIMISCSLYYFFIVKTTQIFVSTDELRNGIWIAVIVSIMQMAIKYIYNKSMISSERKAKSASDYLSHKYKVFKSKYDTLIQTKDEDLKILTYAIMIYENYNRPKLIRVFEYFKLLIKRKATLGIMQVSSNGYVNDIDSVKLGFKIIQEENEKNNYMAEDVRFMKILQVYNNDAKYGEEVFAIYTYLKTIK